MQKSATFVELTKTAQVSDKSHGARAKCLQRLLRLDMPVPRTAALPTSTVRALAHGETFNLAPLMAIFGSAPLVSRSSALPRR